MVNTVLGPISPKQMGATHVHEHCFDESDVWAVRPKNIPKRFERLWDEPVSIGNLDLVKRGAMYSPDNFRNVEFAQRVQELNAFKAAGGGTIVDVTPEGLERDRHLYKLPQVSELSKVHIVACTGQYVAATHPARIKHQTAEQVAQDFIKEITEGINGTEIKAGVIKTAVSPNEFKSEEKKTITAAAIAQKETGVPMTTHTWGDHPGKWNGFKVIDILQRNDVDLSKFYMSHIDWTVAQEENWGVAVKAAKTGIYVSIDNFGNEWPNWSQDHSSEPFGYIGAPTDLDRVKCIKRLIDEGYEKQIVIAHDSGMKIRKLAYGGPGLGHILTNVPTLFKWLKLDKGSFKRITVDNPQRLFS